MSSVGCEACPPHYHVNLRREIAVRYARSHCIGARVRKNTMTTSQWNVGYVSSRLDTRRLFYLSFSLESIVYHFFVGDTAWLCRKRIALLFILHEPVNSFFCQ